MYLGLISIGDTIGIMENKMETTIMGYIGWFSGVVLSRCVAFCPVICLACRSRAQGRTALSSGSSSVPVAAQGIFCKAGKVAC